MKVISENAKSGSESGYPRHCQKEKAFSPDGHCKEEKVFNNNSFCQKEMAFNVQMSYVTLKNKNDVTVQDYSVRSAAPFEKLIVLTPVRWDPK